MYVAPLKALVQEMLYEWRKFEQIGAKATLFTGDSKNSDYQAVRTADIILTTPEKWDSLTTDWHKNKIIANSVGLLLVDEVHLLGTDRRGAVLEGLVSRMMLVQRSPLTLDKGQASPPPITKLRIVALSATINNHLDISRWLRGASLEFGEQYRPLPLQYEVKSYYQPAKKSAFLFANTLNHKVYDVIRERRYSVCRLCVWCVCVW